MINNIIKHWNKIRSDSLAGKDDPFSIDKVYTLPFIESSTTPTYYSKECALGIRGLGYPIKHPQQPNANAH